MSCRSCGNVSAAGSTRLPGGHVRKSVLRGAWRRSSVDDMSIAELERPVCRAFRPHSPDRRAPASERIERRLQYVAPLVVDDGCDVRLRSSRCPAVVRLALLEWLPLTRGDLLICESGIHHATPTHALAALVRPPTVWTASEALLATRLVGWQRRPDQRRFAALREHAFTRIEEEHLKRLRGVAARFAQQLPFDGLPRASATIGRACAVVVNDDEACAAVTATVLARYAASAFVARRRREAAPTMT